MPRPAPPAASAAPGPPMRGPAPHGGGPPMPPCGPPRIQPGSPWVVVVVTCDRPPTAGAASVALAVARGLRRSRRRGRWVGRSCVEFTCDLTYFSIACHTTYTCSSTCNLGGATAPPRERTSHEQRRHEHQRSLAGGRRRHAREGVPTDRRPLGYWLRTVDGLLTREFAAAFDGVGVTRRDWMLLNALSGDVDAPCLRRALRPQGQAPPRPRRSRLGRRVG